MSKTWNQLSDEAKKYFRDDAMWDQHFDKDIIEECQEFYASRLDKDEYGRRPAANAAWIYGLGASRHMKKP